MQSDLVESGVKERRFSDPEVESNGRLDLEELDFSTLYTEHVDMVWRGLRSLGIQEPNIEDAVQDVFLVVHRRLSSFEARSSFRTWLFGIVLGVARNLRRQAKKRSLRESDEDPILFADARSSPHEEVAAAQALRKVADLLSNLDEAKHEVFVLAEIEEMTAPEIADVLNVNVNTVYSRLRAARREFEALVARKGGLR